MERKIFRRYENVLEDRDKLSQFSSWVSRFALIYFLGHAIYYLATHARSF